ncbi:MAG: thioesterase family protein [Chloroflexota bacterium]
MTTNQPHPFDLALQLKGDANRYHGQTSAAYANVRGPFGGITAAVLLKALLDHPERQGDPLTITINYAAPTQDGPFVIETQLMRTNRSTQHWFATLEQGGGTVATATAVFAIRRDSWGDTERPFPTIPPADQCTPLPNSLTPPWTKMYEFHSPGGIATMFGAADNSSSSTVQWIRDEPPRPLDFLSLTAMCDVFFPRLFVRLGRPTPIGTVAFTIYFHTDAAALTALTTQSVIGEARSNRFSKGYFDQAGEIWTPDGELLATTHQIVYFKA